MDRFHDKLVLRAEIIALKKIGLSASAIARTIGVSEPTVYKWSRRCEDEGNSRDRPRSGAPKKTSRDQDQRIVAAMAETPINTAVALRNQLQLQVSVYTVRKRLHNSGVHHRTPAKKPKLTEAHRMARLRFAQRYVNEDMQLWGSVVFSDEKTLCSSTHGRQHCWRQNGTRWDKSSRTFMKLPRVAT